MRPGVGVALFIWKGGKFLVMQRQSAHGKGTWSIPGGHLEMGETFAEAAARETFEEVGVTVKNIRLLTATNDIFATDKHYVSVWLEADYDSGEPTIMEPHKISDLQWVDIQHLPEPLFEPCWQNLRQTIPEFFEVKN